jgi:putative redox protein
MTRQAVVKWVDGLKFVGTGYTNHAIVIDGPADAGGNDSAVRPGEMLLMALAACTGIDVVSLLKKMRVQFDSFEIGITAEAAENHPKYFKKIDVEYRVRGRDIPPDKLQRAIDLSRETYCSVSAQLRPGAELNYSYKILAPEQT